MRPFEYVCSAGKRSTVPPCRGNRTRNVNRSARPGAIRPPDHVTMEPFRRSVQPNFGGKESTRRPAGSFTVRPIVAACGSSLGTVIVRRVVLPAATRSGLTSTWARAAGASSSARAAAARTVERRGISVLLPDRDRECSDELGEGAAPYL